MSVMEKPVVEFIDLADIIVTSCPNDIFVCTVEQCNLQGCPDDDCTEFDG